MGLVVSASACGLRRRPLSAGDPSGGHPAPREPEPELTRVFRLFDADGDGHISAAELRAVCGCSAAEAEEMVTAADGDGDGFIDSEELATVLAEGEGKGDGLREAFEAYDEDGDGVITAEELRRALRRLGFSAEATTVERCAEMVSAVDADGDGVISFDEFKAMMTAKRA